MKRRVINSARSVQASRYPLGAVDGVYAFANGLDQGLPAYFETCTAGFWRKKRADALIHGIRKSSSRWSESSCKSETSTPRLLVNKAKVVIGVRDLG